MTAPEALLKVIPFLYSHTGGEVEVDDTVLAEVEVELDVVVEVEVELLVLD